MSACLHTELEIKADNEARKVVQIESLIDVIKRYEKFSDTPYVLFGIEAIGYGHTNTDNLDYITEEQADSMLRNVLTEYYLMLSDVPDEKQRLLLAALAYNIGIGKVKRSQLYLLSKRGINDSIFKQKYLEFSKINSRPHKRLLERRKAEIQALK